MSALSLEEILSYPVAVSGGLSTNVLVLKPLETGVCAFLEALLNILCDIKFKCPTSVLVCTKRMLNIYIYIYINMCILICIL